MPFTSPPTIDMDLEDFRRLGVRPYECRLTVIRRAAARSAKALAEKQLTSPSDQVGLQLSRVTASAYRLLDPRQRQDPTQRVHVGRILPNALTWAGHTNFHSESPESSVKVPFSTESARDAASVELLEFDTSPHSHDDAQSWAVTLNDGDLLESTPRSRRAARMRSRWPLPWVLLSLAGLTVGAMIGLATLRQSNAPSISKATPKADVTAKSATPMEPAPTLQPSNTSEDAITALGEIPQKIETSPAEISPIEPSRGISPAELIAADPSNAAASAIGSRFEAEPRLGAVSGAREPSVASARPAASAVGSDAHGSGISKQSLATETSVATENVAASESALPPEPPMLELSPAPTAAQADTGDGFLPDPFAPAVERSAEPPPEMSEVTKPELTPITDPADPSEMSGPPTAALAVAQRHSVPDDAAAGAAREQLVLLIPELAQAVTPKNVKERIAAIEALEGDLTIGSAEHWSTQLWIAQLAWSMENVSQVSQRLESLTEHYDVSLERPLAESFVAAADSATLPETHQHFLSNGLELADQLLMSESPEQCKLVVDAIVPSAELLESESSLGYLDDFSQAAEQTARLGESAKRMMDEAGEVDRQSDGVGILGRYYCLMLRQWEFGLQWLTEVSDARIASVARAETELGDTVVADDLISLSQRWFSVASRSRGRASDSMRLHAIEILQRAGAEMSGLTKLEVERKIDEAIDELPPFLRDVSTTPKPSITSATTVPETRVVPAGVKRGLGGRIQIDGDDIGVQLDYELGVPLTQSVLDMIAGRLERTLPRMSIQFVGEFELDEPATIVVSIAPQQGDVGQVVLIDGTAVETDLVDNHGEVELEAGKHKIAWSIEAESLSRALLRMHDAQSGRRILVTQPRGQFGRTTLTVGMLHASE